MDGSQDLTGKENILIVVHFINFLYEPIECLLTIATADERDAVTPTDIIIEEKSTKNYPSSL